MPSNSANFVLAASSNGACGPRDETYLSIEETATYLNVPVRMVRRLRDERRVRSRKVGKYVRFALSDLRAFVEANTDEAVGTR